MLLEFQRALACGAEARLEAAGGVDGRAMRGGVPVVNATRDRQAPDTSAIPWARQTAPEPCGERAHG